MQGCVCPHPPLLIPEVGRDALAQVETTVRGMEALAGDVGEPQTIVVISPHTSGYGDAHVIKTAPRLSGDFGAFGCPQASWSFTNDQPLVELLLALAGDSRHVRLVAGEDDLLDHGVLVPMSFLRCEHLVSLSITNAYADHRPLGQLVRRCAEELGRDVLFVASGDLSHRLIPSAPAGYDPRGKLFDAEIERLLAVGDFAKFSDGTEVHVE